MKGDIFYNNKLEKNRLVYYIYVIVIMNILLFIANYNYISIEREKFNYLNDFIN